MKIGVLFCLFCLKRLGNPWTGGSVTYCRFTAPIHRRCKWAKVCSLIVASQKKHHASRGKGGKRLLNRIGVCRF